MVPNHLPAQPAGPTDDARISFSIGDKSLMLLARKLKMNETQLLAIMAAILAARGNKSKQLENAVEDAARLWEIVEAKVATKPLKSGGAGAI